ncbi:MAG: hypothetical protein VB013_05800 [Anaerolineaceae bacterium]|nr:hypothetical protein [Anaerolineaceae bacterium]
MTKVKIKINDIPELRTSLDAIYETKTQIELAQWALNLAQHILTIVGYDYEAATSVIQNGFTTNRQWQSGTARMFDVRQAGFKVHQLAKICDDPVIQAAIRVAGQAVGTGHMREHAMVASDYAIKTINLKYPNDINAVRTEREWQITTLK